jgi:hypothetical protein
VHVVSKVCGIWILFLARHQKKQKRKKLLRALNGNKERFLLCMETKLNKILSKKGYCDF